MPITMNNYILATRTFRPTPKQRDILMQPLYFIFFGLCYHFYPAVSESV